MAIIQRVTVKKNERGVVLRDGDVDQLLPPGRHWLVSLRGAMRVDRIDVAGSPDVPRELAAGLARTRLRPRTVAGLTGVLQVVVPDHAAGLLRVDGTVVRRLPPGSHAFWRFHHEVSVDLVDLRLQSLEVSGHDLLTCDRVPLSVNLSASWHVADPVCAYAQLHDPVAHLHRELQFGLRAAVGTRTLHELLEDRTAIDDVVAGHVRRRLWAHGVVLDTAGVRDFVLPRHPPARRVSDGLAVLR